MENNSCQISKYASIVYRLGQTYFDRALLSHQIGSGQQFFLLKIYENPGISMLELANHGHFDKGTTNRAVCKLESLDYISVIADKEDKRFRRLFATERAAPIVTELYDILEQWNAILTTELTDEDVLSANRLFKKVSENALTHMQCNKDNLDNRSRKKE